jgi:hypothetical protein
VRREGNNGLASAVVATDKNTGLDATPWAAGIGLPPFPLSPFARPAPRPPVNTLRHAPPDSASPRRRSKAPAANAGLPLEPGEGLVVFTDQKSIGDFQKMPPLDGRKGQAQALDEFLQRRRWSYNTREQGVTLDRMSCSAVIYSIPAEPNACSL